jgi:hypothetical protein
MVEFGVSRVAPRLEFVVFRPQRRKHRLAYLQIVLEIGSSTASALPNFTSAATRGRSSCTAASALPNSASSSGLSFPAASRRSSCMSPGTDAWHSVFDRLALTAEAAVPSVNVIGTTSRYNDSAKRRFRRTSSSQ